MKCLTRGVTPNWCQPNRQGVSRLDAFFDTNERRYFITPQSVTFAIEEELSKQVPGATQASTVKEPVEKAKSIPKVSEATEETEKLREQVRDLEILGRVKNQVIKTFDKDREAFDQERQRYVSQLMAHSRKVGELETHLLQLGAPVVKKELPQASEEFGNLRESDEGFGNY